MPLRTEITADHDDWPDDEPPRLRGHLSAAREALASVLALIARLPVDHPAQRRHATAAAGYRASIAYTTGRLREIGQAEPERMAA